MNVSLRPLFGKLNSTTRAALEGAAGLCVSRTHYNIEIEHLLFKLLESDRDDFAQITRRFGVDRTRLAGELSRSIDRLKSGNTRNPAFSPSLLSALSNGWLYGSIDCGATEIRTGFIIVALLADDELSRLVRDISKEMQKISVEALRREFAVAVRESVEDAPEPEPAGVPATTGGPRVFISYRREDTALYADYLFMSIRNAVADVRVFRDADTLQPGMIYTEKINETIAGCDILLVLIGKKWFGTKEPSGARRIDLPDDWVRLEVAAALEQNKLVIPCLVDGAVMPNERELPPDLSGLAFRHSLTFSETEPGGATAKLIEQLRTWRRLPRGRTSNTAPRPTA